MNHDSQTDAALRHKAILMRIYDALDRIPGEEHKEARKEIRECVRELGTLQAFTELAWRRGTSVQEALDYFNADVEERLAAKRAAGVAP